MTWPSGLIMGRSMLVFALVLLDLALLFAGGSGFSNNVISYYHLIDLYNSLVVNRTHVIPYL